MPLPRSILCLCLLGLTCHPVSAQEPGDVQRLIERARKSLVAITYTGRDGREAGLGAGFVVDGQGLIATNLHVIGEGRPIAVRTADGKSHKVTAVHAWDRELDLAVIRIEAQGLDALVLGDSDGLRQGQPILALGHPRGLQASAVQGVVSALRDLEGRRMIQVAMPVEPGNSGGPVLDMAGNVQGIMTLKSALTPNLGFAMAANQLKPLLEKPTPIPMTRWLTIGALESHDWQPLFGGDWRQRAGRILVSAPGDGFGGRALCLWQEAPPEPPYEIALWVRLADENGAAGIAFASDGGDKHYGFYPTAGRLRLTRFDGPVVFTWVVLADVPTPHYKPGQWNLLKVRVEPNAILCYVNDQLVIQSDDKNYRTGKAGLAKFRDTQAEFRGFALGRDLPAAGPDPALAKRIEQALAGLADLPPTGPLPPDLVESLAGEGPVAAAAIARKAEELQQNSQRLRELAAAAHERHVQQQLVQLLGRAEAPGDLVEAALLIAWLDNPELDRQAYRRQIARMAGELTQRAGALTTDTEKLALLNEYLFKENGFHGSRTDYYHRANSYLNEVLDDREGLPITLCVLYLELGRRIGLNLTPAPVPGQFMVRFTPAQGEPLLVDVFEGGQTLTQTQLAERLRKTQGLEVEVAHLTPATPSDVAVRILRNLLSLAEREGPQGKPLRYVETLLAIAPDMADMRLARALMRFQAGQYDLALQETAWILEHQPEGLDLERVRQLHEAIQRAKRE